MARGIVRLTHSETGETFYFEWSTVCDAPASNRMTLDELRAHLDEQDRLECGCHWLVPGYSGPEVGSETRAAAEERLAFVRHQTAQRLKRLEERGTSFLDEDSTGEQFVSFNRAGERETCISADEIIERYAPREA